MVTVYKKGLLQWWTIIVIWICSIPYASLAYTNLGWIEDKMLLPDDASLNFAVEKKGFESKLSLLFEDEDDISKSYDITPINVSPDENHVEHIMPKVKVIVEAAKVTPKVIPTQGQKEPMDSNSIEALDWKQQIANAFEESDVISFAALIGLTVMCLICIIFLIYRCRKSQRASKMDNYIDTLAYDKSSLSIIELTRQPDIRDFFHSHT